MNIEYEFRFYRVDFTAYEAQFKHLEHKSSNNSVFVIKLLTTHPDFKRVMSFASEHRHTLMTPFLQHQYSEKELLSAEILYLSFISVVRREMFGEDYGTKYEVIAECDDDITLKQQSTPLRINDRHFSSKDMQETFSGEVIISERFMTLLEANNITGYRCDPIYRPLKVKESAEDVDYYSEQEQRVKNWFQLVFTAECGYAVPPTKYGSYLHNFSKQDQTKYKSSKYWMCGKYRITSDPGIGSAFYFKRNNWPGTNIAVASQLHGTGYYHPFIIISQKVYRLMKEHKITGFKAEPAFLVD